MGPKLLCAVHNGGVTALPFFCLQVRWNPVISRGWWLRCCTRSQQWLPWVTWQTCPRTSTSRPPSPARTGGSRGSTASSDRAAPPARPQIPSFLMVSFFILMLLYHPPSPQCSQAFWSWAKLLWSTGLWRARVRSQRCPWRRSLTLSVGYKGRWGLTPFSWLWGEQSKPKCPSLQWKHISEQSLPLHHPCSGSGAVTWGPTVPFLRNLWHLKQLGFHVWIQRIFITVTKVN